MKYRTFVGLLLLFVACIRVTAQPSKDTSSKISSAQIDELHESGSAALFNLDYVEARQIFKKMARRFPDDPTGPRMLAWTLWLETLNQARLRQAAIYSSQSFEASAEDKPDPKLAQEFRDSIRQAAQLTRARLQSTPHDPLALYTLGDLETLRAAYEITIEGRLLAGLRDGSSGVDKHRDVIKVDPNFHDAEMVIGLYDYIVGNLPLPAKLMASLTGAHGSKKRGLQTLERVARDGYWERDYARLVLMVLYKHEKRFADSLALSRALQDKYPQNYLFRLETADALISEALLARQSSRAGAEKEPLSVFESIIREDSSTIPTRALAVIHFRFAEALLALSQSENAAHQFLAATTAADVDSQLVSRSHLRAAQAFDLAGKRKEALAEYRIVLTRPNTQDSLEQARRGLKEPYRAR